MSNYNTNDFDQFITEHIDFTTATPPTGNTGDMEQFITDRIDLAEFTKAPEVSGAPILTTGAYYAVPIG